jgi:ribA/ribD-fused uncharacterized protein
MPQTIDSFTGRYAAFSLFYRSGFFFEGDEYQSAAAAIEAAKIFNRPDRVSFIGWNCRPWKARTLGKGIPTYWIRPDWKKVEPTVMLEIQRSKFSWPDARDVLLSTEDAELIYGNVCHDNFWGVCKCRSVPTAQRKYGIGARCTGAGEDKLGRILMQVREECKTDPKTQQEMTRHVSFLSPSLTTVLQAGSR